MQQGGGVGYDFSTLRPNGARSRSDRHHRLRAGVVHAGLGRDVRHDALHRRAPRRHDGDAALRSSRHRGIHRRQARRGRLRHFNLSVQVTDAFMQAVEQDETGRWCFRQAGVPATARRCCANGRASPAGAMPRLRHVRARELWDRLLRATYDSAEPGVLFIDRINRAEQSLVPRTDQRHESLRRNSVAALRRLRSWFDQSDAFRAAIPSRRTRAWTPTARGHRVGRRAPAGQRHRRLAVSAAGSRRDAAAGRGASVSASPGWPTR